MSLQHNRKRHSRTPSRSAGPDEMANGEFRRAIARGAAGPSFDLRHSQFAIPEPRRSLPLRVLMAGLLPAGALMAAAIWIAPSARATDVKSDSTATAPADADAKATDTKKEPKNADNQPAVDSTPKKEEKAERDHPVHDFSKLTGRDEDTCSACHMPHVQIGEEDLSNKGAGELFKIARQRPALATGRYTPGPTSMICLTCHNGSVAVSTVGTAHAMRDGSGGAWSPAFATRDHPIGVPFPVRQKGFRSKARVEAAGKIKLPEGRVECISCHDQHEEEGWPHLLVMSNKRSALCLSCHEK